MAYVLTSRPSKKSKLRRLSFLPRIGITVDFAGTQYSYFQVPILEMLVNLAGKEWNLKNVVETSHQQISELELPTQSPIKRRKAKKPTSKK